MCTYVYTYANFEFGDLVGNNQRYDYERGGHQQPVDCYSEAFGALVSDMGLSAVLET